MNPLPEVTQPASHRGLPSLCCLYPNALLLGASLLPDGIARLWLAVVTDVAGAYSFWQPVLNLDPSFRGICAAIMG